MVNIVEQVEYDSKEKANYLNNQGVFDPLAEEVRTINRIIFMTNSVIKIEIIGIGRIRAIRVGCM